MSQYIDFINEREYDFTISRLRDFFKAKKFVEVPVQHRLSILAACEDPFNVASFIYAGNVWPLPQTGQMWLEYELLKKPAHDGLFCITTSYRQEPDPVPGRHDLIFPMFEFEMHGGLETLRTIEGELIEYLGFGARHLYRDLDYAETAKRYNVKTIEAEHEKEILDEFGPVCFLMYFPEYTSPFWNMKRIGDKAKKIDVLLHGMETIGSAERSTNPNEMRERFHTISDGGYAKMLYAKFTKERVERELENFLSLSFFPRSGGGIGITRMIRALKLHGLMPDFSRMS